jgi:two-component system, NtrC family, sensor histidine kinase KinB
VIRYNFAVGLTIILLLLLLLSGYTVVQTRHHAEQIEELVADSYDTIRASRLLRRAMTDLNIAYLAVPDRRTLPEDRSEWTLGRNRIESQLAVILERAAHSPERDLADTLKVRVNRYLQSFSDYLSVNWRDGEREFERLRSQTSGLTGEVEAIVAQIVDLNEAAMFARRDDTARGARRTALVVLGIAIGSLLVYAYTSYRLTKGVLDPLREFKDAIVRVRERRFDEPVPEPRGPELAEIARAFNAMAEELRVYLNASDARLLAATRLSQQLLEALPYPVFVVRGHGAVEMSSPRAQALAQKLGIDGLPGAVRARLEQLVAEGREEIATDIRSAIHLEPEGSAMEVLPQVFRIEQAANPRDALWAVLLIDVTDLRRMDQAKTRALSLLGHEVKTPVSSIRMAQMLLLEEQVGPLNRDQRELVATSHEDCERLLKVLQSLLELARLESGRAELRPVAVSARDLLEEVTMLHAADAERQGAELLLEVDSDVPAVQADPLRIGRVLANFTTNALKYGEAGRPIRLQARPLGTDFVRFSVVNEGSGLTEEQQAKVFEPFYRRPGEAADGTGLGLALAKEIVQAHRGRIGVASEPGRATAFYCDLPVAESPGLLEPEKELANA